MLLDVSSTESMIERAVRKCASPAVIHSKGILPVSATPQQPKKKSYQSPSLKVYGDVRALTRSGATTGKHFDISGGKIHPKTR